MKKLSIITINYNNCNGLKRTIESVIKQTFTNYEYIVIDGGSTDGSIEVIKQYLNKITYWVSEPDRGIYHAMNKGILNAKGEYCNFMNSGDEFYSPNTLNRVFSQECQEDIILGEFTNNKYPNGAGIPSDITLLDLCKIHPNHQSSFIKRKLFENNLYDESLKILSDWKFFINEIIFKNCSYKTIPTIVAIYDSTGISATQQILFNQEHDLILKRMLPPRIYANYIYFIQSDSPLLKLTPYFNKTRGFQWLIYRITYLLIRVRLLILKILGKN